MTTFGRVLTAMVTPFNEQLEVDYKQAALLARHLVENGSDGLVVAGSTGEAATLSETERMKLFAAVVEAVGDKAFVIGGTGSNDTASSIRLSQAAVREGLHGLMLVAPYYNKPSQEGLYRHFAQVAQAVDLPIIVYNVPGRTGVNILPDTVVRLAALHNIAAVKESSGNLEQIAEIISKMPEGFQLYCGDDALTLPVMAVGGYGVISVASHVAGKAIKRMVEAFVDGNTGLAKEIHLSLLPIFKVLFIAANPVPVKAAVNMLGLNAGGVRLPLVEPTAEELAKIRRELEALRVKLAE